MGPVIIAFLMEGSFEKFFWLGVGSWFIGTFCYEAALNHVNKGTIYKPVDYKWHILGYDIPWWGGKKIYILPTAYIVLLYGIFMRHEEIYNMKSYIRYISIKCL